MSIRETEPTALPEDAEPETQYTPNFFIHPTPQPDPEVQAAADTGVDSEVEVDDEIDDETAAYDEPQPEPEVDGEIDAETESEPEVDDELDADDEPESETVEAESEVDDEIAASDEPEPETAESEVDDEIAAYGESESETAETEPDVDDAATVAVEPDVDTSDEVEPQAVTDGQPGHNGDGPAEAEPEGPAEVVVGGRPYLRDGGVFEERWTAIQTGFVDDPRLAVESADHLITEAIDDLATILAGHRETLQAQWRDDVDTEQLRVVFRDYRAYLLGLLHT